MFNYVSNSRLQGEYIIFAQFTNQRLDEQLNNPKNSKSEWQPSRRQIYIGSAISIRPNSATLDLLLYYTNRLN